MPAIARRRSIDSSSSSASSASESDSQNLRERNPNDSETGPIRRRGGSATAPTNTLLTESSVATSATGASYHHSDNDEMQQIQHEPPSYSAPQLTHQPSSFPTGSGNRILFPRAVGVKDQRAGFGAPVAEDWGREPIYVGTAFHGNGTQHPGM